MRLDHVKKKSTTNSSLGRKEQHLNKMPPIPHELKYQLLLYHVFTVALTGKWGPGQDPYFRTQGHWRLPTGSWKTIGPSSRRSHINLNSHPGMRPIAEGKSPQLQIIHRGSHFPGERKTRPEWLKPGGPEEGYWRLLPRSGFSRPKP